MTTALALAPEAEAKSLKTKDKNVDADCLAFGRRLVKAMRTAEITQAELSRLMGVSRSAVNWWIQGLTYPSVKNARDLANILRVTPEYLVYGVVDHRHKDRMTASIPVIDKKSLSKLDLPKSFVTRELRETGDLRGVTIYTKGQSAMIAIADVRDKLVTETPRPMLIDFGGEIAPRMASRDHNSIVLTDMTGQHETHAEFKDGMVFGHMVASLNVTGGA